MVINAIIRVLWIIIPMKYLVRRCFIELSALETLSTYLSGIHIRIDSKKRCWSFRKKKVIKHIEKIATAILPSIPNSDPRNSCTIFIFRTSETFWLRYALRDTSSPLTGSRAEKRFSILLSGSSTS